jgi:hypothetical protein
VKPLAKQGREVCRRLSIAIVRQQAVDRAMAVEDPETVAKLTERWKRSARIAERHVTRFVEAIERAR